MQLSRCLSYFLFNSCKCLLCSKALSDPGPGAVLKQHGCAHTGSRARAAMGGRAAGQTWEAPVDGWSCPGERVGSACDSADVAELEIPTPGHGSKKPEPAVGWRSLKLHSWCCTRSSDPWDFSLMSLRTWVPPVSFRCVPEMAAPCKPQLGDCWLFKSQDILPKSLVVS